MALISNGSTVTLQTCVDNALANGDTAPALATGGYSDQPALQIANTVLSEMINGGPNTQPYNWKWNRLNITPFFTNSWQQDYFIPGLVGISWLESCYANEFNLTSQPKPKIPMEARKDLIATYVQFGWPAKIAALPNRLLFTGTWGATEIATPTGQNNPGPGVVITNPAGLPAMPLNPITQVQDAFGNLWVVTTYGTCGNSNPFATNQNPNNQFPTLQNPTATAATVTDGTVIWTAINPTGQGFRLSPIPPQQGQVWQINPLAQMSFQRFTALTQTIDPIPDAYSQYFMDGFIAQCYRRHPDPKIRSKFNDEYKLWLTSLDAAVKQADRELDDYGFYPMSGCMDGGGLGAWYGPAWPFAGPPFGSAY
jgi:hypothetical protein